MHAVFAGHWSGVCTKAAASTALVQISVMRRRVVILCVNINNTC